MVVVNTFINVNISCYLQTQLNTDMVKVVKGKNDGKYYHFVMVEEAVMFDKLVITLWCEYPVGVVSCF